ncbi:hypothetical protein COV82_01780 [Candidatus Peregrinibacteria bacterium CG11_big_fil_rev_8_21_14_0_20_46_8]|nr:MAG: hypothetical protein COV82_01780 [Candidatus Peregrinibacteria bacterium CG11_big_fil_rev_8_21_14_0_20_46_8]
MNRSGLLPDFLFYLQLFMKQPIEIAPHVSQYQGSEAGPSVTILGGVHGNEITGVEVIESLKSLLAHNAVQKGTLNLGIGNWAAYLRWEKISG